MENHGKKRTRASKNNVAKKKKILIGLATILVIAITGLAAYSLSIKGIVNGWENKIYPGVTVQNVDVGGMTKEEAEKRLKDTFENAIDNKKLFITVEDKEFELIYSYITPNYDIEGTINEAFNLGKEHGLLGKYMAIKSNSEKQVDLGFSYDEEKLKDYENKLIKDITKLPKDATLSINGGSISVKPEVDGVTVDLEELDSALKKSINGNIESNEKVNIETKVTKAKVTSEDLAKVKGVMGSFSTSYGTSAAGRSNNIEVSTKAINGTIVMPGETFSFNDIVGPRTIEKGYQEAGTYVGNKVEPGIGGGICQVSTTLYRAVMRANIRSLDRTNHSMAVGYSSPGLDATVSYGYLDYKFTNPYDFPIYIEGTTAGKVVSYNIYGDPSVLEGKTYDMMSEIIETLPPETKIVEDNTLDEGIEVNEGGGMTGYKSIAYQLTYENGVEVSREIVSRDSYAKVDIVVKKGTKPIAPPTSETPPVDPATPQPDPNLPPVVVEPTQPTQ